MNAQRDLYERLLRQSGFAAGALSSERFNAHLRARASELRVSGEDACAERILIDDTEYARLEAAFSPPETWLFRYDESCDFLRARVRTHVQPHAHSVVRALIVGAGGWCEPVTVAAAMLDGAQGAAIEVLATDRNPEVFAAAPLFAGMHVRSSIPAWAASYLKTSTVGVHAREDVLRSIRAKVADAQTVIDIEVLRSSEFEVLVFRNVAIYLEDAVRNRIFVGLAKLLAPDGVLLVGHAEMHAAAAATGLVPHAAAGAFALTRRSEVATAAFIAPMPSVLEPTPWTEVHRQPLVTFDGPSDDRAQALDPLHYHARALELELAGDVSGAFATITRALYLDPSCEEALVLAARLCAVRGAHADAERFRMRALRSHLDRMYRDERDAPER